MAKNSPTTTPQKRKPRLLWANPFCLLDTSSGASMTVRQMLHQLVKNGYEVQVLGCTIFDNPKGMGRLEEQSPDFKKSLHQLIEVEDGALSHQLVVTARTTRNHLTAHEEGLWYNQYLYLLDSFKPDIVWFYGGQTLDLLIPDEARARGIPAAFYLANGNYKAVRWCRDIDLILTDSQSTADMYRTSQNAGFAATPVGKFIDPANFVAETHERKRLLFVNPSWQKGASVVVQLALALEKKRPDIQLEVVEARADWSAVLREATKRLGEERTSLSNVIVTPNTNDMRGPYSRARLLLAPSLWWESSGRVLAEAMLNGIPALITNRGGMPEMIGDAGLAFDFPEECYEEPYQHLLDEEQLHPLLDAVLDFYDDTVLYEKYVQRAWEVGKQRHHIEKATERLVNALTPLIKLKAGNKDFTLSQQKRHRQGLASIASKPKFKVDASLLTHSQNSNHSEKSTPLPTGDFDWQIEGKVIVLDSRAKLLKMGAAKSLTETGAFGIIAFDPASEVSDPKQYEGSETIQVFQHALLGDGNPATLHTCLDAGMSSTLEPLPQEELPEQHHQGAKVLTKLPINTVALDNIEGLPSIDWLILDELSDTATILEHGQQALKDTLIIQARVAFQPTHKHQPSLAELQHWASRNGFRFYRLNESQHTSHLPQDIPEQKRQATELVSADALFLPSAKRMKTLSEGQRTRLAFLLHTVFNITDITFEILNSDNAKTSKKYLEATGLLESTTNNAQRFKNVQDIVEHLEKARLEKISSNHTLPGKLVVSLTSYKARFNNLHLTLRSLLLQETQPDLLVLWIAEHEKNDIPDNVWELEQYGLTIRFCEDLRSYKKIIPTLEEHPDSFIVTADDDLYYKPDWLQQLVASWDGHYKTITAHRAHKIRLDKKGNPAPYRSWKWQVGPEEAADGLIVPTGCGGVMYPPRVFHEDVTKPELFMELCADADDIWLYWMASLNGAMAKRSDYTFKVTEWPTKSDEGLWKKNIFQAGNDNATKKMQNKYQPFFLNKKRYSETNANSKKRSSPTISLIYRDFSGSNAVSLYKNIKENNLYDLEKIKLIKQGDVDAKIFHDSDIIVTTHGPIVNTARHKNKFYADLWHGLPLKTIGLDMKNAPSRSAIFEQWSGVNFKATLSELHSRISKNAFNIDNNSVFETGSPRNDLLIKSNGHKNLSKLLSQEIKKHIIVYAPTFRKSIYWPGQNDGKKSQKNIFGFEDFHLKSFEHFLQKLNAIVVVKTHPAEEPIIKEKLKSQCKGSFFLLTSEMLEKNNIDFYETLNASSMLITDYSSIFIDYLLLDKPILFSIPDRHHFELNRGLYSGSKQLTKCGLHCDDQPSLQASIKSALYNPIEHQACREGARLRTHSHTDDNASYRVMNSLLKKWEITKKH